MEIKLERINTRNHGYYLVKAPVGYPGKKYGNYVYEHRAVYWLYHGTLPSSGFHIHHINGDRTDNRPENLEAISALEHSKHRHNGGKEEATLVELECHYCKSKFTQLERTVNYRKSTGQIEFFCKKKCQVIYRNHNHAGAKHSYPQNRKSHTPMVNLVCSTCKNEFQQPERVVRERKRTGSVNLFCSRSCINKK
jgi:hypothetical protein